MGSRWIWTDTPESKQAQFAGLPWLKPRECQEDSALESLSPMFIAIQKYHRILNPDRNGDVIIVAHESHESE